MQSLLSFIHKNDKVTNFGNHYCFDNWRRSYLGSVMAWPWPKLGITISSNKRPAVLRRLVDHLDAELDIGDGEGSMLMMVACTILACMMEAFMIVAWILVACYHSSHDVDSV